MTNKQLQDEIIFYAFRYCLGRRTFAVSDMVEYLLNNWNDISKRVRDKITEEITTAIKRNEAGMDCDVRQWKKLLTKEL